jgi:Pleckstrin homology domain
MACYSAAGHGIDEVAHTSQSCTVTHTYQCVTLLCITAFTLLFKNRDGKKWRRRWFLLKDGALSYYHNEQDARKYRRSSSESVNADQLLQQDEGETHSDQVQKN